MPESGTGFDRRTQIVGWVDLDSPDEPTRHFSADAVW
jgi:hypothetical protein